MTIVTLKIRSMSPKSNYLLMFSDCCIRFSLVKLLPLIKKIECRQDLFIEFHEHCHLEN